MDKWDSNGLKLQRSSADGPIVVCAKTDKDLYYVKQNGTSILLDSFGRCRECAKEFHVLNLFLNKEAYTSEWPIQYEGAYCKECYHGEDLPDVTASLEELDLEDIDTEEADTEESK